MVTIWACGALLRARSESTRWQTTMLASPGTVSTLECSTVRSGRAVSVTGRTPRSATRRSEMASLTRRATNWVFLSWALVP